MVKFNKAFDYYTVKQVAIDDKFLVAVHYLLKLGALCYVIFYIGLTKQAYLDFEICEGMMTSEAEGNVLSMQKGIPVVWDPVDYMLPQAERGAAFVSTKVMITRDQTVELCAPEGAQRCTHDEDCGESPPIKPGKCGKGGKCMELQWCPPEMSDDTVTEVNKLQGVENVTLSLQSAISFPKTFGDMATFNTWTNPPKVTIKRMLDMAGSPYERVVDRGGMFHVALNWTCGYYSGCSSNYTVRRLDDQEESEGFKIRRTFRTPGSPQRDLWTHVGLRIFLTSHGSASSVSLMNLFVQFACIVALMTIASSLTDFLMLWLLPDRNDYRALKIDEIPEVVGSRSSDKLSRSKDIHLGLGLDGGSRSRGTTGRVHHDFVMVFDKELDDSAGRFLWFTLTPKKTKSGWKIRERLYEKLQKRALLTVEEFESRDGDEIFVKLGSSSHVLEQGAQRMKLRMKLKNEKTYAAFTTDKKDMFQEASGESLFRSSERQQIVLYLIETKAKIDIDKKLREGDIKMFFPRHEWKVTQTLLNTWANSWFAYQPLDEIRDYFGEKVAIYFAWLGFYTSWLWVTAIFGSIVFLVQIITGNDDNALVPVFCFVVSAWSSLFLEFWKRENASLAFRWDVMEFEEEEPARPEFSGTLRVSPVTGKMEKHYAPWKRYVKLTVSYFLILIMIFVVIVTTIAIMTVKIMMIREESLKDYAGGITGVATLLSIAILNKVYEKLANVLNDWENHRTDTEFEDAYIAKTFVFQFVNSYISLYYIAFFKEGATLFDAQDHCIGSCLAELRAQLATMFVTKIVVNNLQEIIVPKIVSRIKLYFESRNLASGIHLSAEEEEAKMSQYDSTFDDYNEMVIQFGFVTLFAVSFPLAPLLALVNNLVEVRSDAYKLLKGFQRPYAQRAEDIGTWLGILEIMSVLAVVTNCLLIGFTSTELEYYYPEISIFEKLGIVVIAEHVIFLIKIAIAAIIPDQPQEVTLELEKQRYKEEQALKRELGEESSDDDSEIDDEESEEESNDGERSGDEDL